MSISVALQNAVSGLQLNQRALDTVSQNVANVNTDGYSRKIVNQEAVTVDGQGAGVTISSISRQVNEYLLKDLRTQTSQMNQYTELDSFYGRMQDLFGAPGSNTSLGHNIGDLATSVQALAISPEDNSLMSDVASKSRLLAQQFNDVSTQIQQLRQEADANIGDAVDSINTQLSRIQELNVRIAEDVALGKGTADLRDQRDVAMNELSKKINISYYERSNGEYVIFTNSGRPLLDRTAQTVTHAPVTSFSPSVAYGNGSVNTIDLGGNDITGEITSGSIAGWVSLRDDILPNLQSQFEELAQHLADQVNAVHNDGTAYPGLSSMTGTRKVAATDPPTWTGSFRVAVTDSSGKVVETQDFNLGGYATVGALVTAINGMTNASASIDANGHVVITAAGSDNIATNEMTSAVTVGNQTMGAAQFLGLNDLFTQPDSFDIYTTAQQDSSAAALASGTLTFTGPFGTTNVAVTAGDSLSTVAASINANATLAAANITASVITDGTGYRLKIADSDGDNFFVSDSSSFISSMNLKAHSNDVASSIAVRSDILSDPARIARAELSDAPALAVGDQGVTAGGQAVIDRIETLFNTQLSFDAVGQQPAISKTLADYGTSILSLNATQAQNTKDSLDTKTFLQQNLQQKTRAISGVNIDEEMSNMIVLQNAYAASARVITTASKLFDELLGIGR